MATAKEKQEFERKLGEAQAIIDDLKEFPARQIARSKKPDRLYTQDEDILLSRLSMAQLQLRGALDFWKRAF